MINIAIVLDDCGIFYTEKQLKKIDKILNNLLKKHILLSKNIFKSSKDHNKYFEQDSDNNYILKEKFSEETEFKDEIDPFVKSEPIDDYIENNYLESSEIYDHDSKYEEDVVSTEETTRNFNVKQEGFQQKDVPEFKVFKCNYCKSEFPSKGHRTKHISQGYLVTRFSFKANFD